MKKLKGYNWNKKKLKSGFRGWKLVLYIQRMEEWFSKNFLGNNILEDGWEQQTQLNSLNCLGDINLECGWEML